MMMPEKQLNEIKSSFHALQNEPYDKGENSCTQNNIFLIIMKHLHKELLIQKYNSFDDVHSP